MSTARHRSRWVQHRATGMTAANIDDMKQGTITSLYLSRIKWYQGEMIERWGLKEEMDLKVTTNIKHVVL